MAVHGRIKQLDMLIIRENTSEDIALLVFFAAVVSQPFRDLLFYCTVSA